MVADVSARLIAELDRELKPLAGVHSERALRYRDELQQLHETASDETYDIAFIGVAGVGKTTAICKLLDLYDGSDPVLSVAAGRTTLCQVEIVRSNSNAIEVVALSEEEVQSRVEDVVQVVGSSNREGDGRAEGAGSTEVQRSVRNMAGLTRTKTSDPLKELLASSSASDVAALVMQKIALARRTKLRFPLGDGSPEEIKAALKVQFKALNYGTDPDAPFPDVIRIHLTDKLFVLPATVERVVDTRGIDGSVIRDDLIQRVRRTRTIPILCSAMKEAPDMPVTKLLEHIRDSSVPAVGGSSTVAPGTFSEMLQRSAVLVLSRTADLLKVTDDVGDAVTSAEEGARIKLAEAQERLRGIGAAEVPIEFLDAERDPPDHVLRIRMSFEKIVRATRERWTLRVRALETEAATFLAELRQARSSKMRDAARLRLKEEIQRLTDVTVGLSSLARRLMDEIADVAPPTVWAATKTRYRGDYPNFNIYDVLSEKSRVIGSEAIGATLTHPCAT